MKWIKKTIKYYMKYIVFSITKRNEKIMNNVLFRKKEIKKNENCNKKN